MLEYTKDAQLELVQTVLEIERVSRRESTL